MQNNGVIATYFRAAISWALLISVVVKTASFVQCCCLIFLLSIDVQKQTYINCICCAIIVLTYTCGHT